MKRFIYGLLSLFAALVLVRASSYGAVGRAIEHTGDRLIGSAGVALLVVILMAVAYHLLVPRAVRKWLLTFPELFHRGAKPVEVVRPAPRRRAAPRQQLVVVTGADLQGLGLQGLITAMQGASEDYRGIQGHQPTVQEMAMAREARPRPRIVAPRVEVPEVVAPAMTLPPHLRRKMDDVRGACKEMGWKAYEYDPLIAAMNPEEPVEKLLTDAIRALSKPMAVRS